MEERLMDTLEARRADTLGQDYLARARALRPLIAAAADEAERRRELTPEIVDALIENGIFRMLLPKSLGGAELDPLTYTAVLEELAQGDGSTAWCLGQNSGCSMIAPYLPADTAEEVFGGPRGILAWGPDLPGAGRTVAVEGGYRLTGRWGFATGSRHASWLGCHVPVFELDGSPRQNNVIQSQIAQCEARLKSARAYLRGVIGEMWEEARETGKISPEHHPQLRLAATWAIHQARDIVATVYHAAGASAIFEANPLERRMRDIHAGTQQGQGRAVHFETVGQMLLGLPPEGRMFR